MTSCAGIKRQAKFIKASFATMWHNIVSARIRRRRAPYRLHKILLFVFLFMKLVFDWLDSIRMYNTTTSSSIVVVVAVVEVAVVVVVVVVVVVIAVVVLVSVLVVVILFVVGVSCL